MIEPGFRDPRHCLVFWARPPNHILKLACHLQTLLQKEAPSKNILPSLDLLCEWAVTDISASRPLAHAFIPHALDDT